jgi:DNA-binding HxlR family transcriptional regulator
MAKATIIQDVCPMTLGINILSGKWKLQIVWRIYKKEIVRFNELQKSLGNITTKTLTQQLRELEDERIVKRTVYAEVPPKVEYSLTDIGKTISPVLKSLCDWGEAYQKIVNLE